MAIKTAYYRGHKLTCLNSRFYSKEQRSWWTIQRINNPQGYAVRCTLGQCVKAIDNNEINWRNNG